jgi:hypothetical protein
VYRLAGLYSSCDELKDRLPRAVALLTDFAEGQQDAEGYLLLSNVYRKMNDLENAKLNFKPVSIRSNLPFRSASPGPTQRLRRRYNGE